MTYVIKKESAGSAKIPQLKFNDVAKADKVITTLAMPIQVIPNAFASAIRVGTGNLLRVAGVASNYIWFGTDSLAVPTSTDAAISMPAEFFYVIATNDFVRTSSAVRIEVVED